MTMTLWPKPGPTLDSSAQTLRDAHYRRIVVRCDHMFGILFVIQWIACIGLACFLSPYTWQGVESHVHPHVWAAMILGGTITSFPLYLILTRPGAALTRHVVAAAQMLFSALLIHICGGRIETHFHIFGSLAFLAFYRDWRVLVTATVVVALDHFLRGMYWPQSVFGVAGASQWRWLEHAGWVLFEDVFLIMACVQGQEEMTEIISTAQRQKAADRANEAKSQFLAQMSHEIRTPMNGVVGMIDLLNATDMTDAQKRYAQLAREAAAALLTVINDILDFSKIEAGKVEIERVDFDLHGLVEDLTELLTPVAAKKKLAFACLIRPEVPRRAVGDPNRIRQVLANLVNNAMKFTKEGSVSIRVALERRDARSLIVRMQVEDTGIGIPADRLDRLFKSFSQVDSSTTRKFGGTGLGLAISKQLVELMGGQIGVESRPGGGTTFWFSLMLMAATEEATETPSEILRNVRVLAVEPHQTYRRILSEQLEGRLSPASAVLGADEALEAMNRAASEGNPFSVALIPLATPDGTRLVNAIRSDSRLRQTNLIAVVDIDDRTETAAITRQGFFARLHRPLTQSRLFDTIASATFQAPANPSPGRPAPGGSVSLKGLHVLVAEDNEMNQFVTQETLRRADCMCEIVADGRLAVEASERKKYDAILMDCQMPGMDGLEATRLIRLRESAAPAAGRVPIIALTAEAIAGDRQDCLAAGMDGYVSKPINADELFAVIRSLVSRDGAAAALPGAQPAAAAATEEIPINVEALFRRCMNDAGFAIQTLEKFHQRALGDVELLRRGIAAGDIDGTTCLAHNLKSVSAHAAAAPMRKLAFDIEQAAGRRDLKFMEERLAALDVEARRCAAFIPEAMNRLKGKSTPVSSNRKMG